MWAVALLCAVVVAILVYYMNSKSRITQKTYLAQRAAVSALGSDAVRQRAMQAISTWKQELNPPSTATTQPLLGVLTKEFLSTYSEIVSPNGAHCLGLKNLAPSRYRPEMWAIGKSDYLDICVLPGVDTVYVIDGSETGDDLDDQYPSVFHLLVDYGEPAPS